MNTITTKYKVPLYRAAHGRTGDKGDRSNISVIAWHPALFETIVEQLTAEVIAKVFCDREPSAVTRYLVPNLDAMNVVIDNVLDGGVNHSRNLDTHGKALSFLLLDTLIEVDAELIKYLAPEVD